MGHGAGAVETSMTSSQQKQVAAEFDAYRDNYQQSVNSALAFSRMNVDRFVRAKAFHLIDEVDAHFGIRRPLAILDLGCGIGQYHPLIAGRFDRVVGIDVSGEAIAKARENNPGVEYLSYAGGLLPFADASFDVTFAICVLHHVPPVDWAMFVSESFRVTKPGGIAFLFEHNPYNPLTRKVVSDCPFDRDAVLVKQQKAQELFLSAGFQAVRIESILTIPAVGGVLKKVDRLFAKLPFGTQYCLKADKS